MSIIIVSFCLIRLFQSFGSTYSPTISVGSILTSPIVTIYFINLTLSLMNGFTSEEEIFISKSLKTLIFLIKSIAK